MLEKQEKVSSKLSSLLVAQTVLLKTLKKLSASDKGSTRQLESLERTTRQLHLVRHIDYEQRATWTELPARLDAAKLASHTRSAIERATVEAEPFAHFVIEDVFPAEFYELLIQALPPPGFWRPGQTGRENWTVGEDVAPLLTEAVWHFTNDVVAADVLIPALVEKAAGFSKQCPTEFGPQLAAKVPLRLQRSGGRLMLRRPGYCIQPHLDPARAILTFLLYLAREGDSEDHGTKLYRVREGLPERHRGIFYAYERNLNYEFAKLVPYCANTALVFLSQRGLHGAEIPSDASPSTLERYTYQFYIGRHKARRDAPAPAHPPRDG